MSNRTLMITLFIMAAGIANAESYRFTLPQAAIVDGKELKPGDYKIDVTDTSAVLHRGKESIETRVKTEAADKKYDATSVRYTQDNGKYNIQEIRLGGTKTKLVFESGRSANGGL